MSVCGRIRSLGFKQTVVLKQQEGGVSDLTCWACLAVAQMVGEIDSCVIPTKSTFMTGSASIYLRALICSNKWKKKAPAKNSDLDLLENKQFTSNKVTINNVISFKVKHFGV